VVRHLKAILLKATAVVHHPTVLQVQELLAPTELVRLRHPPTLVLVLPAVLNPLLCQLLMAPDLLVLLLLLLLLLLPLPPAASRLTGLHPPVPLPRVDLLPLRLHPETQARALQARQLPPPPPKLTRFLLRKHWLRLAQWSRSRCWER